MLHKILYFALISIHTSESARILGIVPTPSFSHQIAQRPLWKALSLRGHQVVVMTTDPMNDPSLVNLTEIDLHSTYDFMKNYSFSQGLKFQPSLNPLKPLLELFEVYDKITNHELEHPDVQQMLKNESEHFDVVIGEYLITTMQAFSVRFNCPFIGVTSLDAMFNGHEAIGNPTHPILYPDINIKFQNPMSFTERIVTLAHSLVLRTALFTMYNSQNLKIQKYFGANYPELKEIEKNISMLFLNINPAFYNDRPLTATTILVGGGNHIEKPKELPQDIQTFLDDPSGVIYFSLGTNIKSTDLTAAQLRIITDTILELPYKVLWKFDNITQVNSENVKILKWIPQQDVLRHHNVLAFITQAGMQSLEEAMYFNIPVIAMPFFGDQFSNAKKVVKQGFGLEVDLTHLNKESFKKAILKVVQNPRFRIRAKKLGEIIRDQPMTGIEKAVWWTEYVIRHKGTKHLRDPSNEIPIYQYYFLDVLSIFVVSVLIIMKTVSIFIFAIIACIKSMIYTFVVSRISSKQKEKLKKLN